MPKRKISDLWTNECIHCPTEKALKTICDMLSIDSKLFSFWDGHLIKKTSDGLFVRWYFPSANYYSQQVYQRTDFVYGKEEKNVPDETQVKIWYDPASTEWDSDMYAICWTFKTGDEIEVYEQDICQAKWLFWTFRWYTTDWLNIVCVINENDWYRKYVAKYWNEYIRTIKKQQYTISCTDDVFEKVKQIDWVFIS